ncbi:hypothetical protein ACWOAH_09935 [Vagococcus vulneris]|uniref:hypothetical protein n=1 Tax=Vagococcus vulneris TaxID=1977869 RepID=UPI001403E76F|nr:hypothetical protein [Vagococcus vulneris]
MTIVIYFKNGGTALFNQVEEFKTESGVVSFKYFGVSTQVKRQAMFVIDNIAGFAKQI